MTEGSSVLSRLGYRYLAALAYRDYRWVWLASMNAHSAYWALIVARGVLVLQMSGSSLLVGIVTFAAMAPRFIMPPLAGYMADRFNRRDVLMASFALNLANNAVLTALAFAGVLEVWHIVVLSVINGSIRTFQTTATAALVPNVVPREHLLNAVALNQATMQGSRLFGPGLIAPALLLYGADAAFLASTMFYVVGLGSILWVRTRSTGAIQRGVGIGASLAEAVRYVWHEPRLRAIFILTALHCAMTMAFESVLPAFSRDVLDAGGAGVSYLMMSVGAGGLIAVVLVAGVRADLARGRLLLLAGVVSGAAMLGMAASGSALTSIISATAMGGAQASFMAIVGAMVQSIAPDGLRGRIGGLNQINIGGTMALVNLGNGFVADQIGPAAVFAVLGGAFVTVMAVSPLASTFRRIYAGTAAAPAPAAATAD